MEKRKTSVTQLHLNKKNTVNNKNGLVSKELRNLILRGDDKKPEIKYYNFHPDYINFEAMVILNIIYEKFYSTKFKSFKEFKLFYRNIHTNKVYL